MLCIMLILHFHLEILICNIFRLILLLTCNECYNVHRGAHTYMKDEGIEQ